MKYDRIRKEWEKKKSALDDEAIIFIYNEIENTCKKKQWTFKSVYGCKVLDEKGAEVYNTSLHELVYWYENHFCIFPLVVNAKGKWIGGQTALVKFSQPKHLYK